MPNLLEYMNWPEDPLLKATKRRRFEVSHDKMVAVMHREITMEMKEFIVKNHADTESSAMYIHGPQGKSP